MYYLFSTLAMFETAAMEQKEKGVAAATPHNAVA